MFTHDLAKIWSHGQESHDVTRSAAICHMCTACMPHAHALQEERIRATLAHVAEREARSRALREAHLAAVVQRAGEEGKKVRGEGERGNLRAEEEVGESKWGGRE